MSCLTSNGDKREGGMAGQIRLDRKKDGSAIRGIKDDEERGAVFGIQKPHEPKENQTAKTRGNAEEGWKERKEGREGDENKQKESFMNRQVSPQRPPADRPNLLVPVSFVTR